MLPAPASYRARAAPGRGEAMKGAEPGCGGGPCPLVSLRCPCRGGAGRVITRDEHGGDVRAAAAWPGTGWGDWRDRRHRFQCVTRWGMPEGTISHSHDNGAWLNAAQDHALALATPAQPGWTLR
jgi:hypothetical protein